MQISFLNPGFLALLAVIPVLWFLPRRVERKMHGLLRSAVLALLIAALAKPVLLMPGSEPQRVIVVDRSASLNAGQRAEAEQVLAGLIDDVGSRERLAVIELGVLPQGEVEATAGRRLSVNRDGSESSLSAALETAAQQFAVGAAGRIALISDGLSTDRDWGGAVSGLVERGLAVDVYDLGLRDDDVYPAAVYSSGEIRVGDTVEVWVTVVGNDDVTVVLSDGDKREWARTEARVDGRADVALSFEPESAGFMTLIDRGRSRGA